MSAAPAYNYDARAYERERYAQPDISVVPGSRPRTQVQTLPSSVVLVAKVVAVALVVIALLGVVRVTLSSAAVTTAIESNQLSSQIETARAEGSNLEVSQSALSNPTYVKGAATALGMVEASDTKKIVLDDDVVVTDEAGNLSLSGSIAAAALG